MSIKVMDWYLEHSKQDGTKLLALVVLANWCDDQGECYPSMKAVAKRIRRDERTAQRVISELEQEGELLIYPGMGKGPEGRRSPLYYLLKFREAHKVMVEPMIIEVARHYRNRDQKNGRKAFSTRKAQGLLDLQNAQGSLTAGDTDVTLPQSKGVFDLQNAQGLPVAGDMRVVLPDSDGFLNPAKVATNVTPTRGSVPFSRLTSAVNVTPTGDTDVTPTGDMDVTPTGDMDVTPTGDIDVTLIRQYDPSYRTVSMNRQKPPPPPLQDPRSGNGAFGGGGGGWAVPEKAAAETAATNGHSGAVLHPSPVAPPPPLGAVPVGVDERTHRQAVARSARWRGVAVDRIAALLPAWTGAAQDVAGWHDEQVKCLLGWLQAVLYESFGHSQEFDRREREYYQGHFERYYAGAFAGVNNRVGLIKRKVEQEVEAPLIDEDRAELVAELYGYVKRE